LASSSMLEPLLYGLQMVVGVNAEPFVTYATKNTFGVKFANVWIFREQRISLVQRIDVLAVADEVKTDQRFQKSWRGPYAHFLCETALSMGIPGNGAVRRIGPQTDPLVARRTEDAISLKLCDVRVGSQIVDALLFCALGTATFGRGVSQSLRGAFWGVYDGLA
jgi:hypothetical protein